MMSILRRLFRTVRQAHDDRAVDQELRHHLEMETDDLVGHGISREEARRRAVLALGGLERVKAEARDVRRGSWLAMFGNELLWAWRGIRARGAGSIFHAGIIAVSIAASAVVFSATDAFVFNPAPYPNASRLVVFQETQQHDTTAALQTSEIEIWRDQRDLFAAIHAYQNEAPVYMAINGVMESVPSQGVTPGLFEMLGVTPRWGRPLVLADLDPGREPVALITAELASRLYGDPARAIDRPMDSVAGAIHVAGVMPYGFRFPTVTTQIWRPFRLEVPTDARRARVYAVLALTTDGMSFDAVSRAVTARRPALVKGLSLIGNSDPVIMPVTSARRSPRTTLFAMLFGAAVSLLVLAALNIAGLELGAAAARSRLYAVQTALGATRATLIRVALIEGAILTGLGTLLAVGLASQGAVALTALLPPALKNAISNPIDVDARVVAFVTVAATLVWIVTVAPVVWRASRANIACVLRRDDRSATISRGQLVGRHLLMAAQVGVTVALLVVAALFVRSYRAHAVEPKGFDSARLATIELRPTVNAGMARNADTDDAVMSRLRTLSSVLAVSRTSSLLPSTTQTLSTLLDLPGNSEPRSLVGLRPYLVDPDYFGTVGIRLLAGRLFSPGDPPNTLVVDEAFAARYWPKGDALGAEFKSFAGWFPSPGDDGWRFRVVGIASHVRGDSVDSPERPGAFVIYAPYPRLSSSAYSPLTFIARLDDAAHLAQVTEAVRPVTTGYILRTELVDERYARLYGDTRIAANITSAFGLVAVAVAMTGVYGVIAFLVAGRTREIGIRLALGASTRDVRTLVVGPSMLFVSAGAILGLGAALAVSRQLQAQLFGVSASDPGTYGVVVLAVMVTALTATWRPAERAARIDPAVTLKAE